jgi:hypothetical protein
MTYQDAIKKADELNKNEAYAVSITQAESAKSLVGKTLTSKDANNNNSIKIIEWTGKCYIVLVNGTDYNASPVAYVMQKAHLMNIND